MRKICLMKWKLMKNSRKMKNQFLRKEKHPLNFKTRIKIVVGGLVHKISINTPTKDFICVPTKLEKRTRSWKDTHVGQVLKDVGQLINLTLTHAKNHQPLSGSTTFNRIELPTNKDPLNALYVGSHGHYTSELIQLRLEYRGVSDKVWRKLIENRSCYRLSEVLTTVLS
ncbi:unnamed protein product [Lactuca saligna]|uniref:Uncharacterized protein n=1 Tax=Lactuca saligna TaxID=75948 RepID=A0AA35Z9Z1_LACSI|nr:unnamed protein product [Lactuca saligna]